MKIKKKELKNIVLFFIVCLILTLISYICYGTNSFPSYQISTLIIIIIGFLVFKWYGISLVTLMYSVIFFPALTPFYAFDIIGKHYYSLFSFGLQQDLLFTNFVLFIFVVCSFSYLVFSYSYKKNFPSKNTRLTIFDTSKVVYLLIAIFSLASAFVIESGPTILSISYGDLLSSKTIRSSFLVLLSQLFGFSYALLFMWGKKYKKIFISTTILLCLWFFLHAHRVELFGILFLFILSWRYKMNKFVFYNIVLLIFISMSIIGIIRHSPLLEYTSLDEMFTPNEHYYKKAALPGGASNVFLSSVIVINEKEKKHLSIDQRFTMLQWLKALMPNTFWNMLSVSNAKTEHELIFTKNELNYAGGLHLIATMYVNGGFFLVVVYSFLSFLIAIKIDFLLKNVFCENYNKKNLPFVLSAVYIIYLFRLHWYNPQTLIHALMYSFFGFKFLVFTGLIKLRKEASAPKGRGDVRLNCA